MTPQPIPSAAFSPAHRIGGGGCSSLAPAVTKSARIIGQAARRASAATMKGLYRDHIGNSIHQVFFQRGPVLPGRSGSCLSVTKSALCGSPARSSTGVVTVICHLSPGHSAGGLFRGRE